MLKKKPPRQVRVEESGHAMWKWKIKILNVLNIKVILPSFDRLTASKTCKPDLFSTSARLDTATNGFGWRQNEKRFHLNCPRQVNGCVLQLHSLGILT